MDSAIVSPLSFLNWPECQRWNEPSLAMFSANGRSFGGKNPWHGQVPIEGEIPLNAEPKPNQDFKFLTNFPPIHSSNSTPSLEDSSICHLCFGRAMRLFSVCLVED
jgi:hypothetical protein